MSDRITEERRDEQDENFKRSPAVEYGYNKSESSNASYVDCYYVFNRMLSACYGKEN